MVRIAQRFRSFAARLLAARFHVALAGAALVSALAPSARANGWQGLTNQPPFNASTALLLMDGRVLVSDWFSVHWWILTPDANGSYLNGTWTQAADAHDDRLYFASGVLKDGRVIVCGGEYSNSGGSWSPRSEIYDPVADAWTTIPPPTGWSNIGDAPSIVLPDGRYILGSDFDPRTAIFDPVAMTWSPSANCNDPVSNDEQTWTLLPDGTILTEECFGHPASDLYDPLNNVWIALGSTTTDLVNGGEEIGAAILLYNGLVFVLGATPHSCLYTPASTYAGIGTWQNGPDPLVLDGAPVDADDAPACILPSGNVLCAMGHDWNPPTYFLEYDGTQFVRVPDPPNNNDVAFNGRLLPLPTGEVLFADSSIYLYTADGGPDPAWKPTITSVATDLMRGGSYLLTGTQLNGLTNANSYGDECGVATNYPIVRITNVASGHVSYCRAHDPSTMGLATGATPVTARFDVPAGVETGPSRLEVVANGIASDPLAVFVRDPIVIDFDALATGIVVTNQYPEATFSAPAGFANWTVAVSGGSSQPNVLMTGPDTGGSDGLEETDVDFPCPVASLSFLGVNVDGVGTVANVNVYESGVLTATVPVVGVGDPTTPVRVDLTSYQSVTRIEITAISDAGGIAWDDFRFCFASSAGWSNYGAGFPGTLGVPALTAESNPILGSSVTLDLGNSLGATTPGLLMTGLQQAVIPTTKGGDLLLVPLIFLPLAVDTAGTTLSGSVPDDPTLCGVSACAQAIEIDAGAAKGLSFTAGLQLTLGN
jgi:hypothetical protein